MATSLQQWDMRYGSQADLGFEYYRAMAFAGLAYRGKDSNQQDILIDTDSFKELVPNEADRNKIKEIIKNDKKGIKMRKVRNVNKILLLVNLFFCVCFYGFSQEKLEGRFKYLSHWYQFYPDGIFEYAEVGELGVERYGKGHYIIKDSLILNYDLTELNYSGYHIAKTYQNLKDSIGIDIVIYDFDKKPLSNAEIFVAKGQGKTNINTDQYGRAKLVLKKEEEVSFIMVNYNKCMYKVPEILLFLSYEIEVFLTKEPFTEPFDRGYAIKNAFQRYKTTKVKKDFIELQTASGEILKLRRAKEDNTDDPFK